MRFAVRAGSKAEYAGAAGLLLIAACGTAATAETRNAAVMQAICEPESLQFLIVGPADLTECRSLWKQRIETARARSKALRDQAKTERLQNAAAAAASRTARSFTIGTFANDDLAFGDVVMTSSGAKVFIGRQREPAEPGDFVALTDPRSPHRNSLRQYAGALPR